MLQLNKLNKIFECSDCLKIGHEYCYRKHKCKVDEVDDFEIVEYSEEEDIDRPMIKSIMH